MTHPHPPAGVDFQRQFQMSDADLIAAHVRDGRSREYAEAMVTAVRGFRFPTGPNLDYEQMLQAEMKRTGLSRAEVLAEGEKQQADMDAELARVIATEE